MTATDSNQASPASVPVRGPIFPAWLLAMLLGLVTIVLYWPVTHAGFIKLDDQLYVTSNARVQAGLSWGNVEWAFTTGEAANWHPLTWLSLMLDVNLFGTGPAGFHATNVFIHAFNVVLLFWLLRKLTGATWRSALVAAFFGWHPVHVESVAWISERKDVLSTFFGFLSLLFYTHYAREREDRGQRTEGRGQRSGGRSRKSEVRILYGGALICFALGLMSKPMLVTWPFVLLLLDYWPLGRLSPLQPFREKIPFFALAAAACVVTFMAQNHGGAVVTVTKISSTMRVENAVISYCRYLGKLCWPTGMTVMYPHPGHWPAEQMLAALVFLGGMSAVLFGRRRQQPFLWVGWLWFLGTLVPVIGLVQVGDQAMADRYAYIPSVGVLIMIVWGGNELACRWRCQIAATVLAGSTALLLGITVLRQQLGYWQNSETLFRHAVAVTKDNYHMHAALGLALADQGRLDEAISEYRKSIEINSAYAESHNNYGVALGKQGQIDAAISQFQAALSLKPDYADAHNNFGLTLFKKGRTGAAINEFEEALRLEPDDPHARRNLNVALAGEGQTSQAIRDLQDVVRLRPASASACRDLGIALFQQGRTAEAIDQYRDALHLDPNLADVHYDLGVALTSQRQTAEAIHEYQTAIRLKADFVDAHNNLGAALAEQGRYDEAIIEFGEVLRLKPDDTQAQNNLAKVRELKTR